MVGIWFHDSREGADSAGYSNFRKMHICDRESLVINNKLYH